MSVSLVWFVAVGVFGNPAPSDAQAAWNKLQARMEKATSAAGRIEIRQLGWTETYHFKFLRPNLAKFSSKETVMVQDGRSLFTYFPSDNRYSEASAAKTGLPTGTAFNLGGLTGLEALAFPNEPTLRPTQLLERQFEGKACKALVLTSPENAEAKIVLYLDASNGLPAGWRYAAKGFDALGIFRELRLDVPLKASDFSWSKPAGASRIRP